MLGYYDYTVWLTYLSLLSAGTGIIVSQNGMGHPYIGMFFLLVCGLCDAFDGKVARTKKDRTSSQRRFGIQIDSLSDLVAFGVLPACIGNAMIRVRPNALEEYRRKTDFLCNYPGIAIAVAVLVLYMLAALIRLAWFNVSEEDRQDTEEGCRKTYEGLPVTSSALIFPIILTVQYITPFDVTPVYFVVMIIMGLCFISRFRLPKPGMRGILVMVGIGFVDFVLLLVFKLLYG